MVTETDARDKIIETPGGLVHAKNYLGATDSFDRGPQAFRTIFAPHHVIAPHFHRVDQYQIFVTGTATIGQTQVEPVTVHYADGFTPYGPIRVADQEMSFFNLRAFADRGAYWMPGSRDRLERRAGRVRTARTTLSREDNAGSMRLSAVINQEPDGLFAAEIVAGPGMALADSTAGGSGRYQLIIAGSIDMPGAALPGYSVAFASPGTCLAGRRAGPQGVHFLELQLPQA
jgi:hypothetical protein